MDLFNGIEVGANLISLVAIVLSIFVFFTDQFRRWLFFGYKPTVVVIVSDREKNNVLIIKRNLAHKINKNYPWHFPQGGIYSTDLNETVDNILKRELSLEPGMYDFEKTFVLGVKRIAERKIYRKQHFGSFSLYSSFKGKGYVACVVYADLDSLAKKIKIGFGLDSVKIVKFDQAVKLIDPAKAQMLKKLSKQMLD